MLKYPKIIYTTKNHFLRHFYHTNQNSLIIRIVNVSVENKQDKLGTSVTLPM